jgi:uncharacterized membrane protein YfcA
VLDTVFGLPIHPLVVHATVVIVPLAAVLVLLSALWPAARARLGIVTPALALAGLVLVPLSTQSGESLAHRVPPNALVERHAELGDGLLVWVLGLAVAATAYYLITRRRAARSLSAAAAPAAQRGAAGPRWLAPVVIALMVLTSVGTIVQVVRIGHSGAQAAWHKVGTTTPTRGGDRD